MAAGLIPSTTPVLDPRKELRLRPILWFQYRAFFSILSVHIKHFSLFPFLAKWRIMNSQEADL